MKASVMNKSNRDGKSACSREAPSHEARLSGRKIKEGIRGGMLMNTILW